MMIQSQEVIPDSYVFRWPTTITAWLAILLASSTVDIFLHTNPYQIILIPTIKIIGLTILLLCTFKWPSLRSLRGLIFTMFAIVIGWNILRTLLVQSMPWQQWSHQAPIWQTLIADQLARLLPIPFILLTLIGSKLTRQDLFVTRSHRKTPVQFLKRPNGQALLTWTTLGFIFLICSAIILPVYLTFTIHTNLGLIEHLLVNAPAILIAAIINAANEEFEFRASLLGRLIPAVGETQALWLTVAIFAIGHYYGQPSGPIGVLLAAIAGWLWGKSMLETRGWTWAVALHFVQDVVILCFLVLATR